MSYYGRQRFLARRGSYKPRYRVNYVGRPGVQSGVTMRRHAMFMRNRRGRGRNPALRNLRTGGLLGIETKFLDTYNTSQGLTNPADATGGEIQPTGGCTGCLSAPAQGDGATNREGKKIVIKSCLIQGNLGILPQSAATSADTYPTIFIALVQDMQTNGVTINSEDVFTNPSGQVGLASQPFRNMSYTSRFKVLSQRKFTVKPSLAMANDTSAAADLVQQGLNMPFTLSWKGILPVSFTSASTTADVANVTDNSLHLIAFCSATSFAPFISFQSRIRFVG